MSFQKQKSFVLEIVFFFIHDSCMCEGVDGDSRHGAWHVDIRVGMCIILLECVCFPLHEHLGGE